MCDLYRKVGFPLHRPQFSAKRVSAVPGPKATRAGYTIAEKLYVNTLKQSGLNYSEIRVKFEKQL